MTQATLQLYGKLELIDANGVDLTPRSKHARALLAILARSDDARMSRRELENLLWTSDPKSRQMSLRTCLAAIRRAAERSDTAAQQLLQADHHDVWLDTHLLTLANDHVAARPGDLLEGLQLQNPSFSAWLNTQRNHDALQGQHSVDDHETDDERRTVWIHVDVDLEFNQVVDQLQRQVFLNITSHSPIRCVDYQDANLRPTQANDLLLQIVPHNTADPASYALILKRTGGREVLWHGGLDGQQSDVHCTAHEASDKVLQSLWSSERLPGPNAQADYFVGEALRLMFSFVPTQLIESQRLLTQAQALRPHAAQRALACLVALFMQQESPLNAHADRMDVFDHTAHQALSESPHNAMVLATLCHPMLRLAEDPDAAHALAEQALAHNPGLAMANAAMAVSRAHHGDLKQAQAFAERALELGRLNLAQHWFAQLLTEVHIRREHYDDAIASAHRSLLAAPEYRTPMRLLYPLYLATGQPERARKMLQRLRKLEPDYSLDFVRKTPSYRLPALRDSRLLEQADIDLNVV
ncbi:MAG: hypothetical protein AAF499_09950 [Pseudomonadota bacterium]